MADGPAGTAGFDRGGRFDPFLALGLLSNQLARFDPLIDPCIIGDHYDRKEILDLSLYPLCGFHTVGRSAQTS
jgi:hypothetical protein